MDDNLFGNGYILVTFSFNIDFLSGLNYYLLKSTHLVLFSILHEFFQMVDYVELDIKLYIVTKEINQGCPEEKTIRESTPSWVIGAVVFVILLMFPWPF